ncbi:NTP transferase domain-containing protein [Komagataeibacter sp. FNDCR2]|uniref:NTP transferase domain-containing protein n=1 Tax=Komagataeibacter sp. FNDCR2 TaxID=2878682 RepID=UPI001E64DB5E|nr:NTP transferase domain-containing protein [Komagataeibacter sp. FNDCR2]MCE2574088.1 NTP transferase domain-containing protein [Komagataeibacter sp. FNDCR2]
MFTSLTVSLNCAGAGRRLGLSRTKALVGVMGRPLIHWQLDMLEEVRDLRIVVGYQAADVINAVTARRPDAVFVFNHAYASTATGDRLLLAADHAHARILSLDGDLLVHPASMRRLLAEQTNVIGVLPVTTDLPVCVTVDPADSSIATGFSQDRRTEWEWSGVVNCSSQILLAAGKQTTAPRHVFHLLERTLPLGIVAIDAREIDTVDDYTRAQDWLAVHQNAGTWS